MHSHKRMAAYKEFLGSLNPCFNGRCTRTVGVAAIMSFVLSVLILVLMEDALALATLPFIAVGVAAVLILVLMEDALAR